VRSEGGKEIMGITYDSHVQFATGDPRLKGKWMVEARTKSIVIGNDSLDCNDICCLEIDYEDLDNLEVAIKFAQKVRRDKP
jgi:hypothetical protein